METKMSERRGAITGLRFALLFTLLAAGLSGGMFFLEHRAALLLMGFWLIGAALLVGLGFGRHSSRSTGTPSAFLQAEEWSLSSCLKTAWAPTGLAVLYLFHLSLGPASMQASIMSAVFWLFAACYAAALHAGSRGREGGRFLEFGWLLGTGLLALASLAVVYGCLPWPGAILRTGDRDVAAAGARLGGLLQYPNTLGAVMGAALLERLTALAALPRQAFTSAGRWQGQRAGILAPVFALCLLLTESRGALAALAAAWTVAALLLRRGQRLRFALHSAAALGAGALLAAPLMRAGLAPPALQGLAALAAVLGGWAAATAALAAAGPRRALRSVTSKRCAAGVALAAAASLLGLAAALPGGALPALAPRLTGAATLLARGDMYADALRIIGGAPWLGQGGDTWRSLYRSVQSSPYTGSEVHSGLLDLLLELGLAGTIVVLAWIIPALRSALQGRSRLLPCVLILLLHSLIDFDLSYGFLWLLLIWMFRWMEVGASTAQAPVFRGWLQQQSPPQFLLPMQGLVQFVGSVLSRRYSLLLHGFALFVLLCTAVLCFGQAESLRRERHAIAIESLYPQEAKELLRQASSLAPARARLYLALAARSGHEEAVGWLRRGVRSAPNDPELELELGRRLAQAGDSAALEHLLRAVELNRYSSRMWVVALTEAARLTAMQREDPALQPQDSWQAMHGGAELYARYLELTAGGPWSRNDVNFVREETVVQLGEQIKRMRETMLTSPRAVISQSLNPTSAY